MKFCGLDDKAKIQFIRDNIWIGDIENVVDAYPEDLRINIFATGAEDIHTAFKEGNINSLTSILKGKMATRVNNILSHNDLKDTVVSSIIESEEVIRESIGLSEVISSLKGEINKAANKDVDVFTIAANPKSSDPSLNMPIMRIAASIGRKVAYQRGFRFKKANNVDTAVEVEAMYSTLGRKVLEDLESKGYVTLGKGKTTIVDYENSSKPNRKRTKEEVESDKTTTEVESVSLNIDKIISKEDKASKSRDRVADLKYFTHNNVNSDLDTDLSKALAALKVVTSLTLPAGITFPAKVAEESKSKLTENDSFTGDPQYNAIRKELQNRPFTLNGSIHKLFKVLSNINSKSRGDSATKQLLNEFSSNPKALLSLFGIKNTDYYSVDKFDSVTGQNLSKSATLDDTVEYYPSLNYDGQSNLYMTIMNGDNTRGYYTNSVLNPHGSKLARYSLNVGEYKVKANSADYQAILESVVEGLGMDRTDKKSFEGIIYGTNKKIENALKAFDTFNNVKDEKNLGALSKPLITMSSNLPNVPIAELLTSLQTIKELRDVDSNGDIQTSAMVSSDATASGGQITIAQALGTNDTVTGVLEKMSILENKNVKEDEKLRDVYHITENGIDKFLSEDSGKIKRSEVIKEGETKDLISSIIEKLYKKNKRAFTKPPTMTFIYGQGRPAGSVSLVNSIVDTMLDSILDEQTISLIKDIIPKHKNSDVDLESVEGLRTDLTIALTEKDVGTAIYDVMNDTIIKGFLKAYKDRGKAVYAEIMNLPSSVRNNIRVLPATAVLAGIEPTLDNLKKYGVPITKIYDVLRKSKNGTNVLTRERRPSINVQEVSLIHSFDTGQEFHAVKKALAETTQGLILVHDQFIGTPEAVRIANAEYLVVTKKLLKTYDTHQQVLLAVKAYDTENTVANTSSYKSIKEEVNQGVERKIDIIDSSYNPEDGTVIGDKTNPIGALPEIDVDAVKTDKVHTPTVRDNTDSKSEIVFTPDGEKSTTRKTAKAKTPNKLEDMAKSSSIISSLVNMKSKVAPKISITEAVNSYDLKTDTVNINKDATVAQVEHEIIHSYTTGYIASELAKGDKANNTVRYIEKALNKLEAKSNDHKKATRKFKNRLAYILSQNSKEAMLNEFVAIMRTEPDFRSTAEKVLGTARTNNNIWKTLKDLINKAVNWINDADLASDTIDTLKLNAAVDYIIENGESMRTTKNKLFKKAIKKSPVKSLNFEAEPINKKYSQVSEFLNKGTSSILTSLTEKPALKLGATLDTLMMQNFPLYISARNRVIGEYKDFDTLRQLVDKISGGTVNKTIKADYLSAATKIKTERDALISSNNEKAKVLTSSLSNDVKGKLGRFINDMPLHNYFLYAENIDSESKLVDRIGVLTKTLDATAVHKIKAIVDMNINDKVSRITNYNLNTKFPKDSSGDVYRELLALMSIEAIGSKDFFSLKENTDLMDFVKDLSLANSLLVTDFNGQQGMRDSLVMDYYKDPLEIREVTQDSIRNFDISNKTGWKLLKEPTSSNLGAIYRPVIDSTSIDGVFTDIKMLSTDVTVQNNSNNYANVVAGKLILTSKDKETMGLVKSPIEALVRSAAHNLAIKDSQSMRTAALKAEIHKEANTKAQLDELEDIIEDSSTETPWSIKSDIQYNKLPAKIRAEYKSVGKRASDVDGFNDEVNYVRKDIAHWFVGDSMPSLFTNPKLKWMVRATKTLMSSAKMGMAITNPIKVAKDNFSNLNYLAQLGVSPIFIDEEYRKVGRDFSEYNNLTTKRLDLRMKVIGNPNNKALQKKLASLDKKLKANSVSGLVSRGFTNSLGSHLVMQNSGTLSGMSTDIENTIKAVFLNSDGTNNKAARGLMKFANFGGNGENLVKYLSMTINKLGVDSVKHVEEQAVEARNRISKIKTDNDVVGYVTQFAISPNSESVKLGAYVTDLIDMSAKETYYRHLTKVVGMDTEKARLKVIDAFPDYRENLPLAIKAASDLGILMFPSYWIPDIRNDYKLIRDRPLGVAVEALISSVTGLDMTSILDQNIISRATSWGGLVHSPSEAVGFNSLSPVF